MLLRLEESLMEAVPSEIEMEKLRIVKEEQEVSSKSRRFLTMNVELSE